MERVFIRKGLRVYIPSLLEVSISGMPERYWKARRDKSVGTIENQAGPDANELWFVRHDDGQTGFYHSNELYEVKHIGSNVGLLGNMVVGRFQDHLSLLEKMPDEMKNVRYEFVVYYLKCGVSDEVVEAADDVAERLIYFSSHTNPYRFEHDGWMYILIPATDPRQRRPTKS